MPIRPRPTLDTCGPPRPSGIDSIRSSILARKNAYLVTNPNGARPGGRSRAGRYITFLSAYLADHHASVAQVALTWAVLGLAAMAAPALWSRPISTWPGARALAALLAVLSAAAALALVT